MLIGEPMPSQYDWHFRLFGFPIRVTWLFWLIAAALGYNIAMGLDNLYQLLSQRNPELSSPGFPILLCVWVAATFLSILIHELGHALAFRFYGIESQIVLYHMGGMAIPTAGFVYQRAGRQRSLSDWNQIVISAAGPVLQLLSGLAVAGIAISMGMQVPAIDDLLRLFRLEWRTAGGFPDGALTFASVQFYVMISLWWPLFNLLPVYPLDGGHIVQHGIALFGRSNGLYEANVIGAVVGFLVAFWFFRSGSTINALLFVSLAMSNVQALQQRPGPPNW